MSLEDFEYNYGDPRPNFFNYLKTFSNFGTYLSSRSKTIKKEHIFRYVCDSSTKKRTFSPPSPKNLEKFQKTLATGDKPFMMIPVITVNKFRCNYISKARHMNLLVYNRMTHEIERIDIRRYHLSGFAAKLFIKRASNEFLTEYIKPTDDAVEYVPEIDVPTLFIKKLNKGKARDAFPLFMIAYLHCRNKQPTLTSEEVMKEVMRLSETQIQNLWKSYVDYRQATKSKCKEGLREMAENGRCMSPNAPSMIDSMIVKPPKICKPGKVYDSLMNKCSSPEKIVDVDILLDEVIAKCAKSKNITIEHVDTRAEVAIGALNFILSQFPNAKLMYPKTKAIKNLGKKEYKIEWSYNKTTNSFKLTLFSDFWEIFDEMLEDSSLRFIIIFISLHSIGGDGHHANVFIYDKKKKEIERFDGLGRDIHEAYHIGEFDALMHAMFNNHFGKTVKYLTPMNYCPRFQIFQAKEIDEVPGKDLRGNCAVWRIWYIHLRMANPNVNRKDLILIAQKKLEETGSLYKFIKDYHRYIMTVYRRRVPKQPSASQQ